MDFIEYETIPQKSFFIEKSLGESLDNLVVYLNLIGKYVHWQAREYQINESYYSLILMDSKESDVFSSDSISFLINNKNEVIINSRLVTLNRRKERDQTVIPLKQAIDTLLKIY